jgi:hypothetical protein
MVRHSRVPELDLHSHRARRTADGGGRRLTMRRDAGDPRRVPGGWARPGKWAPGLGFRGVEGVIGAAGFA